jgi:hypothetical protein
VLTGAALEARWTSSSSTPSSPRFSVVGILPWWKWLVILAPAVLMAWTPLEALRRAQEVALAPALWNKLVGQIQFVYLPFLPARPSGCAADGVPRPATSCLRH